MRSIQAQRFFWIAALHGGLALALQFALSACHARAIVWPPAGIALGLLLVYGRQYCRHRSGAVRRFQCTVESFRGVRALGPSRFRMLARRMVSSASARFVYASSVRDMALLALGGLAVAPLWSAIGATLVLCPFAQRLKKHCRLPSRGGLPMR